MKYLDRDGIRAAFFSHVAQHMDCTEEEAEMTFSEFPDPFGTAWLLEDYIGNCEIGGELYGRCASYTDFPSIGVFDIPDFRFYTYYRDADVPNHQIAEYIAARHLYQAEDLDEEDFLG